MKMHACSVLLGNIAFAQPHYCAESSKPEQMQRYHRIMCDGWVCVGCEAAPKPFFPAASLLRKPAVLQLALRSCVVCLPAIMLMTGFRFNTSADVKQHTYRASPGSAYRLQVCLVCVLTSWKACCHHEKREPGTEPIFSSSPLPGW